jgi:hypothetical protein
VAPDQSAGSTRAGEGPPKSELGGLFHRLNNQLGVVLANAELLESRLTEETHRARAAQVVSGALEAIATAQQIRRVAGVHNGGEPSAPSVK